MDMLQEAKALQDRLVETRHALHRHPEIGLELPHTFQLVMRELKKAGVEGRRIGNSGVIAEIGQGNRRILLRADMDALPIGEETGLPYASEIPGAMHACGHDLHTTMLLGAATLLKRHEVELNGTAVLLFQPGEEGHGGAQEMIQAGALCPRPDCAAAVHITPMTEYPTGGIVTMPGVYLASNDNITLTVRGRGGHAADPDRCVNSITVALHCISMLEDAARTMLPDTDRRIFSICEIHAGTAPNIIPSSCTVRGTLRMLHEARRKSLLERFKHIVHSVADAYGAEAELITDASMPPAVNDEAFTKKVHGFLQTALPDALLAPLTDCSGMGSEDFAFIAREIPSCYLYIISHSPPDRDYPAHNAKVVFDDAALYTGAAVYAQIAASYL